MLLTLPMRTEHNDCGYTCVDDINLQLHVNGSRIGKPSPRMDSEVFAERYGHIRIENWFKRDRDLFGVSRFEREIRVYLDVLSCRMSFN